MRARALRRTALSLLAALLAAGSGLALPAGADAAGGSGGQSALSSSSSALGGGITAPGVTAPTTTSTVAAVTTAGTSTGDGGISTGSAIGIAVAAFVIIVGIAVAILRDARRRTRGSHVGSVDGERLPGSKRPPKARKLTPAERRRRKRGRAPRRR